MTLHDKGKKLRMNRIVTLYIIGLNLLLSVLLGSCGSAEKSVRKGDAALALGEYAEAAGQYKRAYGQTPPKNRAARGRIAYKMGDAYSRYGNIARAVGAFQNAVRYHYTDTLTFLKLGDALRQQGNYKAAEMAYRSYLDSVPSDVQAEQGIASCLVAPNEKKNGSAYSIKLYNLLNGSRADYCPAQQGNKQRVM